VEKKPPITQLELLAADITPNSADKESRTATMRFYTGASVQRTDYFSGEKYNLAFSMDPAHVDLSRLNGGAPLLNAHQSYDIGDQLGVVTKAWIENGVGMADVRFSQRDGVTDVWNDVASGIVRNVSMGAAIHKLQDVTPDDADDSAMKSYLAVDWQPMEISLVPIPADGGAGFLSHQEVIPNVNKRAIAPQEKNMEENNVVDVARLTNEAITAERLRVSEIRTAVRTAQLDESLADQLVDSGTTADEARRQVLAKLAERTAVNPTRSNAEVTRDQADTRFAAVTAAMLHRHNPAQYKLDDASRQYRSMSLMEIAVEMLSSQGKNVRGLPKMEIAQLAFAGAGTTDYPSILANVANKTLRSAYQAAPQTFKPFCRMSSAADFKPVNRTQLGDAPTLELVDESGEFKYGFIPDGKETYALGTYGKIIAVSRQAIINDDLNAFTRIPELQGRAAARLESNLVWGIITGNPNMADGNALFSSPHANLAGAGTMISVASLGAARAAMRQQTGLGSTEILDLMPKFLIVPTALETIAQQYVNQTNVVYTKASDFNPFAGALQVVAEPRLDTNSALSWYLACGPDQIDTIEYAYLTGQEGVYLETRLGFEVDGMELKARLDFAAKAIDFRGFYKNPGA
jgi:hypothetical protein